MLQKLRPRHPNPAREWMELAYGGMERSPKRHLTAFPRRRANGECAGNIILVPGWRALLQSGRTDPGQFER